MTRFPCLCMWLNSPRRCCKCQSIDLERIYFHWQSVAMCFKNTLPPPQCLQNSLGLWFIKTMSRYNRRCVFVRVCPHILYFSYSFLGPYQPKCACVDCWDRKRSEQNSKWTMITSLFGSVLSKLYLCYSLVVREFRRDNRVMFSSCEGNRWGAASSTSTLPPPNLLDYIEIGAHTLYRHWSLWLSPKPGVCVSVCVGVCVCVLRCQTF